jgi:hypothetical protein
MSCDFAGLEDQVRGLQAQLEELRIQKSQCKDDPDPAGCLKLVATARLRLESELSLVQTNLDICRLLTGAWALFVTTPAAIQPEFSGLLVISSWDIFTSKFDAFLRLSTGNDAAVTTSTYDPDPHLISDPNFHEFTLAFSTSPPPPGRVPTPDVICTGKLIANSDPPAIQGNADPILGRFVALKQDPIQRLPKDQ